MHDAWRAYLQLALGLTGASRRKAEQVVRDLLGKGGATVSQLPGMVEELMSTSRANREALAKLVRYEVDRALGAVGLASADEVGELTDRVQRLERELADTSARAAAAEQAAARAHAAGAAAATARPAKRPAAKTTTAGAKARSATTTSARASAARRTSAATSRREQS